MVSQGFVLRPDDLQHITFDEELEKILLVAARVGDKSGDQTFCSYSSIIIAFLWSDDPTSHWFQEFAKDHNINPEVIYRHRGVRSDARREILEGIEAGFSPSRNVTDVFSRSAYTMLRNAVIIAEEIGLAQAPVGAPPDGCLCVS